MIIYKRLNFGLDIITMRLVAAVESYQSKSVKLDLHRVNKSGLGQKISYFVIKI